MFVTLFIRRNHNEAQTVPSVSPPTFLMTAFHNTIGYFPEGMPLAYLLATVVTGLGILIGSLIHVSHPDEVARNGFLPLACCSPRRRRPDHRHG